MKEIAGYQLVDQLFSSPKTMVYKALDTSGNPVILKMISEQFLSNKEVALFKSECKVNSIFSSPLIAKTIELTSHGNAPVIVLQDIGGETLQHMIKSRPDGYFADHLELGINIAILIIKAIAEIHDKNVIHKDINPSNIIYNQHVNRLNIIDFGLSSELSFENFDLSNINLLEGSLPYISPEQTGRINRNIDYRTDYYSFGITLYEMFSGQLPFQGASVREWVYCHIAREPVPLAKMNDKIPEALSKIIAKLMEKTAEMRFQSPFGIIADLLKCLDFIKNKTINSGFKAGENDISRKFQISQKLYGREIEIELMLEAFGQLSEYNSMLILVKGQPGSGKSSLVGELYKPITEKYGYFISGKFEQFKKDIPYYAFISAFTKLFQIIMTEDEASVKLWKIKIANALSGNAHLIIDLIPELQLLLGIQPVPAQLTALEAHTRFVLTFQKLVDVFADIIHPLVIFIDDLQWADQASLDLLKALLSGQKNKAFLCIGSYRDNEVQAGHPLLNLIESIGKAKIKILDIELQALDSVVISELIKDTFSSSQKEAEELAIVCFQKTLGNPFFLNTFLSTLYRTGEIRHNTAKGKWEWEISRIEKSDVTNNVVDLICNRILELPENTQDTLKQASCIGLTFSVETLSIISEKSRSNIVIDLKDALAESLILPLSENYRFAEFDLNPDSVYRFLHDRVLQATYSLIEDSAKEITHLKIARLLLKSFSESEIRENIFSLIEHYNLAINHLEEQERPFLSELNLIAAEKAKASSAFHQAFKYLKTGLLLFSEDCWKLNYQHALRLHSLMAEIAFLCEERKWMNEMIDIVNSRAVNQLDKTDVFETHILALCFDHKYPQAIHDAVRFLKKIQISIPEKAGFHHILFFFIKTSLLLSKTNQEKIAGLPLISSSKGQAALRIMGAIIVPSYYTNPLLFPVIAFQFVILTLKYGLGPTSPLGLIIYGMIRNTIMGKINTGYSYGKLGIRLLDKLKDRKYWATTSCIYHASLSFWKEPLKKTTNAFIQDYHVALETGNIEYATVSIAICLSYQIFEGINLNELDTKFNDYENFLDQWPKQPNTDLLKAFLQTVVNLRETNPQPEILTGEKNNEEQMISEAMAVNDFSLLASMFVNKFMLAYLFGKYNEALTIMGKLKKWIKNITNLLQFPIYTYYQSLLLLEFYPTYSTLKQVTVLRKIKSNQRKFKKWADINPENFLNKYLLVEAEIAKVKGKIKKALSLYNKSIMLAQQQGCQVDEAVGYELIAKFWDKFGNQEFEAIYYTKASKTYELWGASAKVEQLAVRNKGHFDLKNSVYPVSGESQKISQTFFLASVSLDIETLMDAAKTISGEIVLSVLIEKIMGIILQHAGAQKGILVLKDKISDDLLVKATGFIEHGKQKISIKDDRITEENLPITLIRLVNHKTQPIIISNAVNDEHFFKDSYISKNQLKSILVMPLIHQARLQGIIYLENNLATNVFTSHHLAVLNLLSSQIAISIENAFLYENLEFKVAERTEQIKIQAEELKTTNERLIELDKFKEGMTTMIVHDLKNPLNTILSVSKEVESQQAAKQMLNMVLNILDIQKFESAQMKIQPVVFPLKSCALDALLQVKILYEKKSIILKNNITNDVFVKGDFELISRIFINLLTNAIKYTPNNGEISMLIENGNIEKYISNEASEKSGFPDKFLLVKIIDNGQGIPSDKINLVFDKFSQVEVKSSGGVRSTGLGLTFCKLVVEAHGGTIGVQSELGKGSAFWFYLPKGEPLTEEIQIGEIKQKDNVSLDDSDKAYLSEFLEKLKNLTVYEFSDVNIILKTIESKSKNIEYWKNEVENALRACNEEKFNSLIMN